MLDVLIDLERSKQAFGNQTALPGGAKTTEDLQRYQAAIGATRPEVIVETGTWHGASAAWFVEQAVQVVTVDITPVSVLPGIVQIVGDSVDPQVVARVAEMAAERRTMVVLDSDHSGDHVTAEIDAYGPLVSVGCYLVVEDGICRALGWESSPLDAIEARLVNNPDWERDRQIEAMSPVSMFPAGWWVRRA